MSTTSHVVGSGASIFFFLFLLSHIWRKKLNQKKVNKINTGKSCTQRDFSGSNDGKDFDGLLLLLPASSLFEAILFHLIEEICL
jgi:hypothetical protein